MSPSAEVRGHGAGQKNCKAARLTSVLRISFCRQLRYSVSFSDGHDSGIYSWEYLYDLCQHQQVYWEDYLVQLRKSGRTSRPRYTGC